MRSLSGQTWGSSKTTQLMIYRALIRSRIDYGCIVYNTISNDLKKDPWSNPSRGTQDLQWIHEGHGNLSPKKRARLDAIGPEKTELEPQISCQGQCHRQPPSSWSAPRKLAIPESNPREESFHESLKPSNSGSSARSWKSLTPPWQTKTPVVNTDLHHKISKSEDKELTMKTLAQEHISAQNPQAIRIFTDGSKIDEKVVGAYYNQNNDQTRSFRITDKNTIYTAELIAIEEALKHIENSEQQSFNIFSDSLSAIESIQIGTSLSRPSLMDKILRKHAEVRDKGKNVGIYWISSHTGFQGNDKADELAKASLQHQEVDVIIRKEIKDRYKDSDEITKKPLASTIG